MKKLTIEQKAQAYDRAIIEFKPIYDLAKEQGRTIDVEEFERIFPELKESEESKDERIRKTISDILLIDSDEIREVLNTNNVLIQDIDTWLEKQGNISPTEDELEALRIAAYEPTKNWNEKLQSLYEKLTHCEQGEQKEDATCVAEIIDRLSEKEQEILFKELNMQKEHNKFIESIQIGDQVTRNQDGMLVNLSQLKRVAKPSEKQGEKKPTDKVKPKFHEGDWIVIDRPCQIISINDNGDYIVQYCDDENTHILSKKFCESYFHIWTIRDTKDGDVLATSDYILIFEKLLPKDGGVSYCHYDFGSSTPQFDFNKDDNWYFGKEAKVYPATKEQRGLLFQKMREVGYEWDAEKKELEKIEQKPVDKIQLGKKYRCIASPRYSTFMTGKIYKPEDEFLCSLMNFCSDCFEPIEEGEQKHTEWSEEDNLQLQAAIDICKSSGHIITSNWLKSLKYRVQPKQEWSEGDKKKITYLDDLVGYQSCMSKDEKKEFHDWFKSIKNRYTWKPSEEQLKQLGKYCPDNTALTSLYEYLKQL